MLAPARFEIARLEDMPFDISLNDLPAHQQARAIMERAKCAASKRYFIETYCKIYDTVAKDWIPFKLWDSQRWALQEIGSHKLTLLPKARQLGLTWFAIADAGHECLFKPIADVIFFSRRKDEAKYLLSVKRLRGLLKRLPRWLVPDFMVDDKMQLELANGSTFRAFAPTGGDSYAATYAIIDEADLVPDLENLLVSVEPTIDAGGRLLLLGRMDKDKPESTFKKLIRAAIEGSDYHLVFLGWNAHPDRDAAWYAATKQKSFEATGSYDALYEQYPATIEEALAPRVMSRRFAQDWLEQCKDFREPLPSPLRVADKVPAPAIMGLEVYEPPLPGAKYVMGLDSAEGLEHSDESSCTVIHKQSGRQVALYSERVDLEVFAGDTDEIGRWYNNAEVMIERNNHGHAIILWYEHNSFLYVLPGFDGRPGWASTGSATGRGGRGKVLMYNTGATVLRDKQTRVRSRKSYNQLQSIQRSTLRAPEGLPDDCADSFVLALVGIAYEDTPQGEAW